MLLSCCCSANTIPDFRPRYNKKLVCAMCHKHCFTKESVPLIELDKELVDYNFLMQSCYSAMKAKEISGACQSQEILPEEKDSA